jgi:hypothetical protein
MGSQMALGQETLFTSALSDSGLLPCLLNRSCGRCENSLWLNNVRAIIPIFRLNQIREREVRTTRIVRAMTANTVMGRKSPRRLCRAAKNPTPAGPDNHCNAQRCSVDPPPALEVVRKLHVRFVPAKLRSNPSGALPRALPALSAG